MKETIIFYFKDKKIGECELIEHSDSVIRRGQALKLGINQYDRFQLTMDNKVRMDSIDLPLDWEFYPIIKVRPILDRVIIKPDEASETIGVFMASDIAKQRPRSGTVLAVGPGAIGINDAYLPMMSKVGDKVVYAEFSGQDIQIDGIDYVVLKEGDLLYIL